MNFRLAIGTGLFVLAWIVVQRDCVAQTSQFLPVDGARVGIKGVNLPWLDGAYGHDFGKSIEGWGPDYTRQKAVARFSDIGRMNANVVRIWVFQGSSGVVTDAEGYAKHIDPFFLDNLKEAIEIADSNGVNCYLCLLSSVQEFVGVSGRKNIITDPKARSAFLRNIVTPFTLEMRKNPGVFAFDLANEPENSVYEDGGWSKKEHGGFTWEQMRTFLKEYAATIHQADPSRLVSVGASGEDTFKKGYYLGLGLDFFDYHAYRDNGNLLPVNEIRKVLAKSHRVSRRELELPILIGECGQDAKNDDEIQRRAVAGFLGNAKRNGYAGVLVWSYEWPGVDSAQQWDRLLKGDGDPSWRPAAYEIQKFRWSDTSIHADDLVRFKLSMDEVGNCTVTVKSANDSLKKATEFEGEARPSSRLPNTTIQNNKNGLVRLVHNFSQPDKFDVLFPAILGKPQNARFDQQIKALTLTSNQDAPAKATYAYRVTPPFTVICDGEFPKPNSTFQIVFLMGVSGDTLAFNLTSQGARTTTLGSFWVESKNGKRETTELVAPTEFYLEDGTQQEFRPPLPNARIETPCFMFLASMSSEETVQKITGLLIEGQVLPFFGIGFDERRGVIFTKQVIKGTVADQAGVRVGDLILSINQEKPASIEQAVALLSGTVMGDTATLEVERAGRRQVIRIKSE